MYDTPSAESGFERNRVQVWQKSLRERMRDRHPLDTETDDADRLSRFYEACELWRGLIVEGRASDTEHADFPIAAEHEKHIQKAVFENVERRLNEIIYGGVDGDHLYGNQLFVPTPREAMLLLCAAWLQHIGLLDGILTGERKNVSGKQASEKKFEWGEPKKRSEEFRENLASEVGKRTAAFLRDRWRERHQWSDEDRELLAQICEGAYPDFPLAELDESQDVHDPDRSPRSVHVKKLASLLRLANVCTLSPGYCPLALSPLMIPKRVPRSTETRRCSEAIAELVVDVELNSAGSSIVLHVTKPATVNLFAKGRGGVKTPLTLDVRPALEFLKSCVRRVAGQSAEVLAACDNTRFTDVTLKFQGDGQFDLLAFVPRIWAIHLAATTCATESVCFLALVLKQMIAAGDDAKRIRTVVEAAQSLKFANVVLDRLGASVLDKLGSSPEDVKSLAGELDDFLKRRQSECHRVGRSAAKKLREFDVFVVYGRSRHVMSAIEAASKDETHIVAVNIEPHIRHPAALFHRKEDGQPLRSGEDALLEDWCRDKGFTIEFHNLQHFAGRIRNLLHEGKSVVFPTGARSLFCMADDDSFDPVSQPNLALETPGNWQIANALHGLNRKFPGQCEVVVVAESDKIVREDEHKEMWEACQDQINQVGPVETYLDTLDMDVVQKMLLTGK